jgi:hypothetical protein
VSLEPQQRSAFFAALNGFHSLAVLTEMIVC